MKVWLSMAGLLVFTFTLSTLSVEAQLEPSRAVFGDYSIEPGRRVGAIRLGMSRSEVYNLAGPPVDFWRSRWSWQVSGDVEWHRGPWVGACGNTIFFATINKVTLGWWWFNEELPRLKTPGGLSIFTPWTRFNAVYGEPAILSDVIASSAGGHRPLLLYQNGLAVTIESLMERSVLGLGVYNTDLCKKG